VCDWYIHWETGSDPAPYQVSLGEKRGLDIHMNFKLEENLSLDDIRINILPLVVKAWSIPADSSVTIRVLHAAEDNSFIEIQMLKMTIQQLRNNVVKALMYISCLSGNDFNPEIWINGLCQVIDTRGHPEPDDLEANDTASKFNKDEEDFWHVETLHRHDPLYRGNELHWDYQFPSPGQFFPFWHSTHELFCFLDWVLERHHHPQSHHVGRVVIAITMHFCRLLTHNSPLHGASFNCCCDRDSCPMDA